MKNIIITEKPSVARTIASYLGSFTNHSNKGVGYLENDEWIITWCFGHLVTLCYPQDYDESLKTWSFDTLPFLPENYKYRVIENTKSQFEVIRDIYHRDDVDTLYYCPDPAREGVTIQHYVRMLAGIKPGIKELVIWIDSQTKDEVLKGIKNAKPVSFYKNLTASGVCRGKEDYAIGINISRALTLRFREIWNAKEPIAAGRVMTCVLGMVVDREREISNFVATNYYKITSTIGQDDNKITLTWKPNPKAKIYEKIAPYLYNDTGFLDKDKASKFINGLGSNLIIDKVETKEEKKYAPLLYNLAELQASASKSFKFSPKQTLEIAQKLYEKRLLTYPRTDARVLSSAIAKEIDNNIKALTGLLDKDLSNAASNIIKHGTYKTVSNSKYVDDSKISDHYAIIPTGEGLSQIDSLDDSEKAIFYMVVRRFLSIFMPPAVYKKVSIEAHDDLKGEQFTVSGQTLIKPGYLVVAGIPDSKDKLTINENEFALGNSYKSVYDIAQSATTPPKHYTTGSLILAMENAGKLIEDEDLREQIKGCGVGTSATRAEIIDKLINIAYLNVSKKTQVLSVAPFGDFVYEVTKSTVPSMLDPKMTAEWEKGLNLVADGTISEAQYMKKLNAFVGINVEKIKTATIPDEAKRLAAGMPKSDSNKPSKVSKDAILTYINVPFDDKDEAKTLGARFDMNKKCWYVPVGGDISKFSKWMNGTKNVTSIRKVWLDVPFDDKDEAKKAGARWDKDKKSWYVFSNQMCDELKKWVKK